MTFSLQMLLQTNVRTIRERYLRNVKEDEGKNSNNLLDIVCSDMS